MTSISCAEELITCIDGASPENRHTILTELYNSGKKYQETARELENRLLELQQKFSDLKAVTHELRNELKIEKNNALEALQASAVDKYKLSEAERSNKTGSSTAISEIPRSELYRIDEKFTGENRSLYPAFRRQISIALAQNADRYVTLQSQISLIYQNLGIGPKSYPDRYLLSNGNFSFASLVEVWNVLDVSFRNPNEEEDARDALSRLRQGNKPFGTYLSEFQRLQNLSCITDDKTLIAYIRNGVSANLNLCIGQQQLIEKKYTFDEFIVLCKECVIRLDWMRPSIRGAQNPILPNLTPRGIYPTQPTAAVCARSTGPGVATGSNSVPLGDDPMILDRVDLSHIGPDGHLTSEERFRRFRLNLCMRCGKPGHVANKCNPHKKGKSINRVEIEEDRSYGNSNVSDLNPLVISSSFSSENLNALVLPCQINQNPRLIKTCVFIDSGGNGTGFIDTSFVQTYHLNTIPLTTPRTLRVVDGRKSSAGMITHVVNLTLTISHHIENIRLFVTKLNKYPIILGHEWLARHNPTINWNLNMLRFHSLYCTKSCLHTRTSSTLHKNADSTWINGLVGNTLASHLVVSPKSDINVKVIGMTPFNILANRKSSEVFALSIHSLDEVLAEKEKEELKVNLPDWLQHQASAFSKLESCVLPPHRNIDHKIVLKDGAQPPFGKLYGMTREELIALREWLHENLSKGFIRASSSSAASPVLFVKKPNGKLRLCMDYRALNEITIKNRYPIPLISETLDRLSKAQYFTKLDVIAAFNRIRIAEGDEWKTAFRTRYGLFESLVMPFGLTNAP
ncbi:hypothetical protein EPUL_006356, partial [Erysiphe pulchra]